MKAEKQTQMIEIGFHTGAGRSSVMRAALLLAFAALAAMAQPRVLILTGQSDEPHHHWKETTAAIQGLLEGAGRVQVKVNDSPQALQPGGLRGYAAILINYNGPRWPRPVETQIEEFVRSGKGLVAFHLASYGEWFGMVFDKKWRDGAPGSEWEAYPRIVGMSWDTAKIGHARRAPFQVDWTGIEHPISRGLPRSFAADDELFHRITLSSGVTVLADALSPVEIGGTGNREPLIWVNSFGRGRVFYTTLGHDVKAFEQPGMRAAFARGVEWAATGKVKSQ